LESLGSSLAGTGNGFSAIRYLALAMCDFDDETKYLLNSGADIKAALSVGLQGPVFCLIPDPVFDPKRFDLVVGGR